MKLKSRDLLFIVILLAAVGLLYYLSTKGKAKALAPNPPEHLTAVTRGACLKCHLPDKLAELERMHKHPGKWRDERVSCLLCHAAPKAVSRVSDAQSEDAVRFARSLRRPD